ncbi:MAG: extracellular solute-binding protein [Acholeplasmataceae bacterium]|jgi:spermidine/putrescine-binding protein
MKKIKSLLLLLLIVLMIPSVAACDKRPKIRILAPGEYMSDETIELFEEKYDIRVDIEEFASNEEAITFLKRGLVYDLIMPSDYALEQLIVDHPTMIEKIDWTKINGFNPKTDLSHGLKELLVKIETESNLDLLEYGTPYFWGSVGVLYNKDVVTTADVSQGWELLRMGHKYKVAFYDSSRDALMAALTSLGFSMNSNVKSEVDAAEQWILEAITSTSTVKKSVGYVTDNIFDDIPSQVYDLAMAYTGDAAEIMNQMYEEETDLNLGFTMPEVGTNIWVDFLVVHAEGNKDFAYKFLNHIMSYEGAMANARDLFYISPREDVRLQQIQNAKTDDIKTLFTINFRPQDDIFRYDPKSKELIDSAWTRLGTKR